MRRGGDGHQPERADEAGRARAEQDAIRRAYEDLDSFIYIVTHELKTPVRQIDLYAEFIEEDNIGALLPQSVADIHSIRAICDNMTTMVRRLMEYSKAGFKIIEQKQINMSLLVRQCSDEILHSVPGQRMELDIAELPEIMGDLFLIKLMVMNVVSNSVKYTREKEHAKLSVFSKMTEDMVEFHFCDNGIGFDMKYIDRLFVPFQRLQNEESYEGSGIGLATVRKIANRFGGDASIVGHLGTGCEVCLRLPKAMLRIDKDGEEQSCDSIKVGIIGDMTGVCSYLELGKSAAYKLAAQEINLLGGINGRKVELLFRDDQSISELTRRAAKELTEDEHVDVLMGSSLSPSRDIMKAFAEKNKTLYLDTQQTEGGVASHHTFCLSSMAEQQMTEMLKYLMKRYGGKYYIVAADYNFGILSAEWTKHLVRQFGGEVVGIEYINNSITDFTPLIDRILQVKADVLFSICVFPNHDMFYTQWHERGLNAIPNATTMLAAEICQNVQLEPPILENTYVMASFIEELDMPAARRFVQKFRAQYSQQEVPYMNMDTETAYTAMYIFKRAVELAGSTETEKVIAALESGNVYVDGPGGRVTVRGEDHHTTRSLSCFRYNAAHKAEELFRTGPIHSDYVESMIKQTLGVSGGLKAMGANAPDIQYNMLLNKFR